MESFESTLRRANRLQEITQRIGFALWQLQELEGATAQYYVLTTLVSPGIGAENGYAILEKEQSKTFGATIRQIKKAGLLSEQLEDRFLLVLKERNWLVHRSKASSRSAVHKDRAMSDLISRIDRIAEEAGELLRELADLATKFAFENNVPADRAAELLEETLRKWHGEDAL